MKNMNRLFIAFISLIVLVTACKKEGPLPLYLSGIQPMLEARIINSEPVPPDSNRYIFKVNWTNPKFATDLSNAKFITQVDVVGNNFATPLTSTVLGSFADSMQAKSINSFLVARGYAFGATVPLEARLLASYSNNNDLKISNAVPFSFRTYKVPPRVTPPSSNRLYAVGDATNAWWNLPLMNNGIDYSASQQFIKVNETTYAAKMFLFGGKSYLLVPANNGSGWDLKYAAPTTGAGTALAGPFGHRPSSSLFDANFPSPADDGWYKMTFDFQTGFYTVVDSKDTPVPDSLYAIGDATAGGWDNSHGNNVLKSQYFSKLNSGIFERTIFLNAGASLKFISKITQWQPQFGKGDSDGKLGYNYGGGSDPGTIPIPAVSGNYRVQVDFLNMTYTLTKL
jgi:hypothetical protein